MTDEMTRRDPYGQHRPISNVIYTRAKQRVIPGKLPKLAEATVICTCNGPHVNLVVLPVLVVTEIITVDFANKGITNGKAWSTARGCREPVVLAEPVAFLSRCDWPQEREEVALPLERP